jgi:hypothetical protein
MAEVTLSKSDIDGLARKLDEFGEVLSADEKAILLAIFGLAATSLSKAVSESESGLSAANVAAGLVAPTVDRSALLPRLSDGFRDAFNPGTAGRFTIPGGEVMDSIGVSVGCISWSMDYNMPDPAGTVSNPAALAQLESQLASIQAQITALKGQMR